MMGREVRTQRIAWKMISRRSKFLMAMAKLSALSTMMATLTVRNEGEHSTTTRSQMKSPCHRLIKPAYVALDVAFLDFLNAAAFVRSVFRSKAASHSPAMQYRLPSAAKRNEAQVLNVYLASRDGIQAAMLLSADRPRHVPSCA